MSVKPKIAIITGQMSSPRVLSIFDSLGAEYDITVLAFNDRALSEESSIDFRFELFEVDEKLPGFMPHLEYELCQYDLFITFEISRIWSFQVARFAEKTNKKMITFVSEWQQGFYDGYENIKNIQDKIIEQSEIFIVPSSKSSDLLQSMGVKKSAIVNVSYEPNSKFSYDEKGRFKFRKYISLNQNDLVIMFKYPLELGCRAKDLLVFFKQYLLANPEKIKTTKLLIVGSGKESDSLKYFAHELSIGQCVYFLHQDPEPFINDLFSAVDISVHMNMNSSLNLIDMPYSYIEQLSCGIRQLTEKSSLVNSLNGFAFSGLSFSNARDFNRALSELAEMKVRNTSSICTMNNTLLLSRVKGIMMTVEKKIEAMSATLIGFEEELKMGASAKLLEKLDSVLDELPREDRFHCEALRIKADVHYALGDIKSAALGYDEVLAYNSDNAKALRGLGFVSWMQHMNTEAVSYFKKSLSSDAFDTASMLGLGLVYSRVGMYENALFWIEKSILSGEETVASVSSLVRICGITPDVRKAIESLERVIAFVGSEPSLLISLGNLYLKTGKLKEGRDLIKKAHLDAA